MFYLCIHYPDNKGKYEENCENPSACHKRGGSVQH